MGKAKRKETLLRLTGLERRRLAHVLWNVLDNNHTPCVPELLPITEKTIRTILRRIGGKDGA